MFLNLALCMLRWFCLTGPASPTAFAALVRGATQRNHIQHAARCCCWRCGGRQRDCSRFPVRACTVFRAVTIITVAGGAGGSVARARRRLAAGDL